jgi:hypothetical protein
MGKMSETHKAEKSEKQTHKLHKKNNKLPLVVLLVLLLLAGLVVLLQSNSNSNEPKSPTTGNTSYSNATGSAKLYLKPSSQNVNAGSTVTLEVWVDTGGTGVNAVQANLTYPTDKFDFGGINGKGSAFEVQALSTGGNGKINIARGHVGEIKGVNLVARVNLIAKTNKGDADISFVSGSAVVRTSDHTDILKDKTGAAFKVTRGPGTVSVT